MSSTSDSIFSAGRQLGLGQVSPNQRALVPGGKVYYVGNLSGTVNGNGLKPDRPLATLGGANGAIAKLAGRINLGDVIYIMPGHVESVSAADYFSHTGTAAGFSIVGLGSGPQRGLFNWTAAASTWLLDTAGVEIANLQLNFAVTAATIVVTPITVSAAGCRIVDCWIGWGTSTTIQCGSTLGAIAVTTAGDYFEFLGNFCNNLDVAGTAGGAITLLSLNGADFAKIMVNEIFGATTATTVGPVHFLTTLSSNVRIGYNYIENLKASSTIAVSSAISGVTGRIFNNDFRVNSGILAETISANLSTTFFGNLTADTVNLSGAADVAGGASS